MGNVSGKWKEDSGGGGGGEDREALSEALFFSLLEEMGEDEVAVRSVRKLSIFSSSLSFAMCRFHIVIPPSVPFNPVKDKLVICGLEDITWSINKAVEMTCKNSVQGIHQMVGSTCLKKENVVGKVLEYKYLVLPGKGKPWYEDIRPSRIMGFPLPGIWHRGLTIPKSHKEKSFEKYDDVILRDNGERKERELATKIMLPSLKKIIRKQDYPDLLALVKKFGDVVQSHINGITVVEPFRTQLRVSLEGYDKVCKRILQAWADNIFSYLTETDIPKEASVYGALFYLSLHSLLPQLLPELKEENYQVLLRCLQPELSADGQKCHKLEIIASIIKEDQRENLAENIELALNRIIQQKFFRENPSSIFQLLPIVHFLRGYQQPDSLQEAMENNKAAQYWGLNKIHLNVKTIFLQSKSGSIPSLQLVKSLDKTDKLLKFSYLHCLKFEEFLFVLDQEELIRFFGLPALLFCSLIWFSRDGSGQATVDLKSLSNSLKTCLLANLDQQGEFGVNLIKDLRFGSEKFFLEIYALNCAESLRTSFEILILVHRHFKTHLKDHQLEFFSELKLVELTAKYLKRQETLIMAIDWRLDLKIIPLLIMMFSDSIKLVAEDVQLVGVVLNCLDSTLTPSKANGAIVEAYLELEDLHPLVEEKVKDLALSVWKAGINKLGLFDKEKEWWNPTRKSKYSQILIKAFEASVLFLYVEDKEKLINYFLTNKTIQAIFSPEIFCPQNFPVPRLKKIVSKFLSILVQAKDGNIPIRLLRQISPQQLTKAGLSLDSMVGLIEPLAEAEAEADKILESLRLRTEELEYYQRTTRDIARLLNTFNGRIRNYSRQLERFPGKEELSRKFLADLCKPRQKTNEEIVLKIEAVYLQQPDLIRNYFAMSRSKIFNKDCIEEAITNTIRPSVYDFGDRDTSKEAEDGTKDIVLLFEIISKGISTFEEIGKRLADVSMSLKDVEKYFGDYNTHIRGLKLELDLLKDLLSLDVAQDWSVSLVNKIWCFFQLGNYRTAAQTLSRVAKLLGIEKPFPAVEKTLQIQELQKKDATIAQITEHELICEEILSRWSGQDIEALAALERSMNLVRWIREKMENFHQFRMFVELASISAREARDTRVDKIHFIRDSVSAYSALIFDLGAKSDFYEFSRAMNHLVVALRKDRNLPTKLVQTNGLLAWIKVMAIKCADQPQPCHPTINSEGDVVRDILATLQDPEFCDVKIVASDGEIPASKVILSLRSQYFRSLFSSSNNFLESQAGSVKLPHSKAVLDKVIVYLYSGNMDCQDLALAHLLELLQLLDFINLPREFSKVEDFIVNNILGGKFLPEECLKNLEYSFTLCLETVQEAFRVQLGEYL